MNFITDTTSCWKS